MCLIFLILLALIITFFELKYYKSFIAPGIILTWPFVIIIIVNISLGAQYGFCIITNTAIAIIMLGLLSFFVGEILFVTMKQQCERAIRIDKIVFSDRFYKNSFNYFCMVILIVGVKYLSIFKTMGIGYYLASDGGDGAMTKGFYIHLMLSVYPLVPIFFEKIVETKNYKGLIPIILFLIEVFLTYTKYHAIILVIATLFYFVSQKPKSLPIILIALICLPVALFATNYYLNFRANGNSLQSDYLFRHFLNYFIGGVTYTSTDTNFITNANFIDLVMSMFSPFINLFLGKLLGIKVFPMIEIPYIQIAYGERGNVINFISLIFTTRNYFFGALFFVAFGFFINVFISRKKCNPMLKVYVLTILFLSFFSAYLQLVIPWEIFFWSIIIKKISKIKIRYR